MSAGNVGWQCRLAPDRGNAHEITYPFGSRSFNGKPQATANLGRSRLRLAVKRGDCFVSVATAAVFDRRQAPTGHPATGISPVRERGLVAHWTLAIGATME
jgi:hypothetical protein